MIGAPRIGVRMPPTLVAPLLPRDDGANLDLGSPPPELAARLRIKATKGAVASFERVAIDSDRAATQADIHNLAVCSRFVPKLGLEQNAQSLVGLQRRAQICEPAEELDRFANDRLRDPGADARAIDTVRDREVRRRDGALKRIVEQLRRYDRFGGLLVPAIVLRRDRHDVFAVFENCDLLDPVRARQVQCAHGQRHALRRQRLNASGRVFCGVFDHARAFRIVAVGDQEIADRVRNRRFQDGFLELRLPARPAEIDLEFVAVRAGQELTFSIGRRVGPAVIVRTIIRLVLRSRHLRRVHRHLSGERIGFLAGFRKLPHIAARGRDQSRIDKKRLGRRLRCFPPELCWYGNESVLWRQNRASLNEHRIAWQVDNRGKPDRKFRRRDHRSWGDRRRRDRRMGPRRNQSPPDEAHADAGDQNRGSESGGGATTAHAKLGSFIADDRSRLRFARSGRRSPSFAQMRFNAPI